ncbi:MAG: AMP-binding protein, partial [Rhodobacteraceae bacterium]|nr:AMP-binding protein [Paracoccaceae bacterium]
PREAAWIVGNSGASLLVCDGDGPGPDAGLPKECAELLVGSPQWSALFEQGEGAAAPVRVSRDDIAWLFYTSGTTGRPKGVMLSHWNMRMATLAYALDVDQAAPDQATIYAAPISHGAGIYNFIFVRVGGRHVFPTSSGFDPAEIEALSRHFGETVMFAAPTMVKRMIEAAKVSGYRGEGIRTLVYGGGPMYAADIDEALSLFGPRFVQIYGQGETPMTITSLRRELVADETHPHWRERRASVGQAMSCVEIRIADDGKDVPPGEAGEILVRGPAVMKGYWSNEKATAETLRDGWLHTGDIGRLDEDGFLTLTDRAKDMIISGGINIYPREVEEVIARHPGVLEVSVVGRPSAEWGEDVVAFVVPRGTGACDAVALEAWCRAEMASFKKPKHYVFCSELPKNSYGKVLKTELRERLGST